MKDNLVYELEKFIGKNYFITQSFLDKLTYDREELTDQEIKALTNFLIEQDLRISGGFYINDELYTTKKQLLYICINEGKTYAIENFYGREVVCYDDPNFEKIWKTIYDNLEKIEKEIDKL